MDFITENYLWIILIVIVILMAIVGYVAEKNDFIKKTNKPVKEKKSKEVKEEPIVIEDKGIDELLKDATKKSSKKQKNKKEDENVEVAPVISEPVDNIMTSDLGVINDDIMSPLVSEPVNEDTGVIDDSLFAPLEPISNDAQTELNPIEVTSLQDIDNDSTVVNEEEDIWKF